MRFWACPVVWILLAACFAVASPAATAKQKRLALVIGNSAYKHTGELPNPRNDAADMAAALEKLGFEIIRGIDLDKPSMERTIRQFASALSDAELGLFFYAGHGMQVNGHNYLVPIDAKLEDAAGLDFEVIRLDLIQRIMEREGKTNILFLDACRNNPLARNLARAMGTRSTSIGRGLAAAESGVGTLISFSTQPGNVALDGEGRNSPFAGALVEQLLTSRDALSNMLINVRNSVMRQTENRQVPWEHSALTAKIYFLPPAAESGEATASTVQSQELQAETAFWNAVKDNSQPAMIQSYVDRYPNGTFVRLAHVLLEQLEKLSVKKTSPPGLDSGGDVGLEVQELTRELQRELKRVGCDPGSIDGQWNKQTQGALQSFADRTDLAIYLDKPSPSALDAVKQHRVRVCPTSVSTQASARSSSGAGTKKNCRQETRAQCRVRLGLSPYGRGGGGGQCQGTRTICD